MMHDVRCAVILNLVYLIGYQSHLLRADTTILYGLDFKATQIVFAYLMRY